MEKIEKKFQKNKSISYGKLSNKLRASLSDELIDKINKVGYEKYMNEKLFNQKLDKPGFRKTIKYIYNNFSFDSLVESLVEYILKGLLIFGSIFLLVKLIKFFWLI
jgi:hypothetical protein